MENKIDFVFVVLTYKNSEDLNTFNDGLKNVVGSYKVIVVDSYYSDEYSKNIKDVCDKYGYDYVCVENKGYSYGNNFGITYAIDNYKFDYLIISNPDIVIQNLNINDLNKEKMDIIGPEIKRLKGGFQNPYYYKKSHSFHQLRKIVYTNNNNLLNYFKIIPIGFNKILKMLYNSLYNIKNQKIKQVYALHGSFLIINNSVFNKEKTIFNENMFLFCEEDHLAKLAEYYDIKLYYNNFIKVIHKEDGSIDFMKNKENKLKNESYQELCSYWEDKK